MNGDLTAYNLVDHPMVVGFEPITSAPNIGDTLFVHSAETKSLGPRVNTDNSLISTGPYHPIWVKDEMDRFLGNPYKVVEVEAARKAMTTQIMDGYWYVRFEGIPEFVFITNCLVKPIEKTIVFEVDKPFLALKKGDTLYPVGDGYLTDEEESVFLKQEVYGEFIKEIEENETH